jgi:hypothetical protein
LFVLSAEAGRKLVISESANWLIAPPFCFRTSCFIALTSSSIHRAFDFAGAAPFDATTLLRTSEIENGFAMNGAAFAGGRDELKVKGEVENPLEGTGTGLQQR